LKSKVLAVVFNSLQENCQGYQHQPLSASHPYFKPFAKVSGYGLLIIRHRSNNQSRGMDNNKRFTGTKVVGGKGARQNEVDSSREPEVTRNSTAVLAYQLLNPEVSEEEQVEYQGWVLKSFYRKVTHNLLQVY
jgi:hypothetical protein